MTSRPCTRATAVVDKECAHRPDVRLTLPAPCTSRSGSPARGAAPPPLSRSIRRRRCRGRRSGCAHGCTHWRSHRQLSRIGVLPSSPTIAGHCRRAQRMARRRKASRRQPSTVRLCWLPPLERHGGDDDERRARRVRRRRRTRRSEGGRDRRRARDVRRRSNLRRVRRAGRDIVRQTRHEYSGAEEDGDVDVEEMEEDGPLLDDPEKTALLERAIDDPDGSDG